MDPIIGERFGRYRRIKGCNNFIYKKHLGAIALGITFSLLDPGNRVLYQYPDRPAHEILVLVLERLMTSIPYD